MQQADYHRHRPTPWMQESVSMHKSPAPVRHSRMNQARSEEEEKRQERQRSGFTNFHFHSKNTFRKNNAVSSTEYIKTSEITKKNPINALSDGDVIPSRKCSDGNRVWVMGWWSKGKHSFSDEDNPPTECMNLWCLFKPCYQNIM